MIGLNSVCYYTMVCFATPLFLSNSSIGSGMCKAYDSDNPDRKSLIIDISPCTRDMADSVKDCFQYGPLNTLMLTNTIRKKEELTSFGLPSGHLDMDHLILFNVPFPNYFGYNEAEGRKNVTSLTAIKNDLLLSSTGLRRYKFQHIRLDECVLRRQFQISLEELLFTDRLMTLVLKNGRDADPWFAFEYDLAPNLKGLTINGFRMKSLKTNRDNKFPSLESLDVSNNQIGYIDPDCFTGMPKLAEINLENNNLRNLHLSMVTNFNKILVDGNSFMADVRTCILLRAPQVIFRHLKSVCDVFEDIMYPETTTASSTYPKNIEL
ncbi:uncharacterized protein LOC141855474 [Brevipalpus obovatus]|uniref:uncharacterized protein LOC141855474 n=1 Tax=Brevipalpus obovatus TaxID=246614 RepID=UPI003D9F2C67